ncbi:MAG: DUF3127 domain-containing protein [Cytophagaceae bacterium]|nr:DUF3127 domain-containing protein [Cytophagaceae bacterium]
MAMELNGTLVQVQDEAGGTSKAGNPWVKQEFIVETLDGQFTKKVCFTLFGADKVGELKKFTPGDQLKVSFNLESREYNNRWYTEARAWRLELADGEGFVQASSNSERPAKAAPSAQPLPPTVGAEGGDDDLPF